MLDEETKRAYDGPVVAVSLELNHLRMIKRAVVKGEDLSLTTINELFGGLDQWLFDGGCVDIGSVVGEREKAREPRTAGGMSLSVYRRWLGVGI